MMASAWGKSWGKSWGNAWGVAQHGGGFSNYVAPRRKSVKQFKKEFIDLPYRLIVEEKDDSETRIRHAKIKLHEAVEFSLESEIIRLKLIVAIETNKLIALKQLEKERIEAEKAAQDTANVIAIAAKKQKTLEKDLIFITAYLMENEYEH
jgi:hypothetical protein